ncbi:hypothetical protein PVAG01_10749 [Phlyctema vagabunda]|uniref:Uncharacterized protein n=1 Tax=Phlyctema vagabunda TaxID=108571 RepID=A0ABR4P355_9HELO
MGDGPCQQSYIIHNSENSRPLAIHPQSRTSESPNAGTHARSVASNLFGLFI